MEENLSTIFIRTWHLVTKGPRGRPLPSVKANQCKQSHFGQWPCTSNLFNDKIKAEEWAITGDGKLRIKSKRYIKCNLSSITCYLYYFHFVADLVEPAYNWKKLLVTNLLVHKGRYFLRVPGVIYNPHAIHWTPTDTNESFTQRVSTAHVSQFVCKNLQLRKYFT